MPDWKAIRRSFMVPRDIVYLNNGSFGPAPRVVFDALVRAMKQLEENPAVFEEQFARTKTVVKPKLAAFVGCRPEYMAIVMNLTFGMNVLAQGIRGLAPGDEVLTTDQEYGAVNNIWDYSARSRGVVIRRVKIPVPPESPGQIVALLEQAVTPRTRVISVSHITTTTGLVLPVKQISAMARSRGILTFIDGAHAPGMVKVDIQDIGCDFYTGNCHKWLSAPKGTAFIAMTPQSWERIEPFQVGWGWEKDTPETFSGNFETPGVHNTALANGIGEAVDFQLAIGKDAIEARGRELAETAKDLLAGFPQLTLLTPRDPSMCGSMSAFSFPAAAGDTRLATALQARGIVVPTRIDTAGGWIRVSTHIFNSKEDLEVLVGALREYFGAGGGPA
jgi:isopenicillin-N epimerase